MPNISIDVPDAPALLVSLPIDSAGYGSISCRYENIDFEIKFTYFCETSNQENIGTIMFNYCTSFFLVDQNCTDEFFPPSDDAIYLINTISSADREFQGYMVSFSNSRSTYIVYAKDCKVST
jgi:hypothetical protein